jgi:hypothetical protein
MIMRYVDISLSTIMIFNSYNITAYNVAVFLFCVVVAVAFIRIIGNNYERNFKQSSRELSSHATKRPKIVHVSSNNQTTTDDDLSVGGDDDDDDAGQNDTDDSCSSTGSCSTNSCNDDDDDHCNDDDDDCNDDDD